LATEEKQWAIVNVAGSLKAVKIKRRTERRLMWEEGDSWRYVLIGNFYGTFPTKTLASEAIKRAAAAIKNGEHERRIRSIVKSCVGYSK
jgi:hypothetical protein